MILDPDKQKTEFINESLLQTGMPNHTLPPSIAESWLRSKEYGIDPNAPALPEIKDRNVLTNMITQLNLRDSYFYQSEAAFLDLIGAAIVFTNDHFDVFAIRGNRKLKDKLRVLNFRFGTNLAESRVGTNALAISYLTGKEAWVCGSEHYLSILSDYVCVASCAKPSLDKKNTFFFPCMIIIPIDKFCEWHRTLFSYILNTHAYRQNSILNSNYLIYNAAINRLIENKSIYYLSIDSDSKIIDLCDSLLEMLQLKLTQALGCDLDSLFPSLTKITGENADSTAAPACVVLEYNSIRTENLYAKTYPVTNLDRVIGYIVILSADKRYFSPSAGDFASLPATKSVERMVVTSNSEYVQYYVAKYSFNDIIGIDKNFISILRQAHAVSKSQSDVLINGESGTGKELFAQAIHSASDRNGGPFVSFNCAAVPKELIDSELFGYVDGVFSGARRNSAPGKIELANGGTLFLDEIGYLPLDLQVHLLKVLEDRVITRLGDTKARRVDMRVIASTNNSLLQLVREGSFRMDLYYRLNVFTLDIPPLRERKDDIPLLADSFLRQFADTFKKTVTGISPEAIDALLAYDWPGNIRELRNVIEYGFNLVETPLITLDDIPKSISKSISGGSAASDQSSTSLAHISSESQKQEYDLIMDLLTRYDGNKSKVSAALGISRPALYRRLKKLNIEAGD